MTYDDLQQRLESTGLHSRGAFSLGQQELADIQQQFKTTVIAESATLVLVGNVGSSFWPVFSRSPEYADGEPHPLDRWSQRIADEIATDFDALAVFPFSGPPWHPFQQWAMRAEAISSSPLGLLIHPQYGLWHAYRFGLIMDSANIKGQTQQKIESPCEKCIDQPCLHTCPVNAFKPGAYDVPACASYLKANPQAACNQTGCQARLSCPVGESFRYQSAHHLFHLQAFISVH